MQIQKILSKETFDYSTLITRKELLKITFESFENRSELNIPTGSFIRISKMLSNLTIPMEEVYFEYITFVISVDDPSKYDLVVQLDPIFVEILNNSKSFFCGIDGYNPSTMITDYSMRRIAGLLGETIVGMSDFISVIICIIKQRDLHFRNRSLCKLSLHSSILDRFCHHNRYYSYDGNSKLPVHMPVAEQNPHINIMDYDLYLDNIESFMNTKEQLHKFPSRNSEIDVFSENFTKYPLFVSPKSRRLNQRNIQTPGLSSSDSKDPFRFTIDKEKQIFIPTPKKPLIDYFNDFDYSSFVEEEVETPVVNPKLKAQKNLLINKLNEESIPKEFYDMYDLSLKKRLIPEDKIELSIKIIDDLIQKNNGINLYDNRRKIARLNALQLKNKKFTLNDLWVEIRDINNDIVYVKRDEFEKKLKERSNSCTLIKINDFRGRQVFIQTTQDLINDNFNLANKAACRFKPLDNKKVFLVKLARIKMKEMSAYYVSLEE